MTNKLKYFLCVTILLLLQHITACSFTNVIKPAEASRFLEKTVDLSSFFSGIDPNDATFILYQPSSNQIIRHNVKRAGQQFLPASTYKIPNSLIALETGIATGADHLIYWDNSFKPTNGFWSMSWSKDHTLRSATRESAYWYYQELARKIGTQNMKKYINQFAYGNQNINGGIDKFWLHGDLRISPNEQVEFLDRMYNEKLGISTRSTKIVKEILVLEENTDYRLSGKTGTIDATPTRELAWLVGYVERNDDVWFYALNMEGEEVWEQWGKPSRRIRLLRSLLQKLDVLPI